MYLLFDIGGTKIRIALSDGKSLQEVRRFDTPDRFDDVVSIFSNYKGNSLKGISGGIAGVLNKEKSFLVRSPNLQNWVNVPIKEKLEELFRTRVILENDAALAGLGETHYGAGKDKEIIAFLTISTGIGGARIIDGKIDKSVWGFEPGRQIVDIDKSVWPECIDFNPDDIPPGSIESYASGAALNFRYGKPSYDLKDEGIWEDVENFLTIAIYNTIAYWSPEVIILGGGMLLENAVSLKNIQGNLENMIKIFPENPVIVKAQLNDKSGLYGALSLIKTTYSPSD